MGTDVDANLYCSKNYPEPSTIKHFPCFPYNCRGFSALSLFVSILWLETIKPPPNKPGGPAVK